MQTTRTLTVVTLTLFLTLGGLAHANYIEQGAGDNYVGFEAESFHSLVSHDGKGFIVVDTTPTLTTAYGTDVLPAATNASNAMALIDDPTVPNSDHSSTVSYYISFASTGTYRLYVRDSAFEDDFSADNNYGNEDSFFRPTAFGASAGTVTTHGVSSGTEGTFAWRNIGADYTVTAADLGIPILFAIDDRESGFAIDRIVLSRDTGLNSGELDALANSNVVPEPASLALLALGAACLKRRRK